MKSKPKMIHPSNPPTVELEFGTLHKFDIKMEDGNSGVYQTNKYIDMNADDFPFKLGIECEYEHDLTHQAHPKIKLPKKEFQGNYQFGGKKGVDIDRELRIVRQSSLARAVDVLIHNSDGIRIKSDHVIKLADLLSKWVMKEEPKIEIKTEIKAPLSSPPPKIETLETVSKPKEIYQPQNDDLPF